LLKSETLNPQISSSTPIKFLLAPHHR